MKIAITGHSKGIGKELYNILSLNHTCEGFSRSNGFYIEKQQYLIVKGIHKCDVFVNNAYKGYEQVNLLNLFGIYGNTMTLKLIKISQVWRISRTCGINGYSQKL